MNAVEVAKRIHAKSIAPTYIDINSGSPQDFIDFEELRALCQAVISGHESMAVIALNECEHCTQIGKDWIKKHSDGEL